MHTRLRDIADRLRSRRASDRVGPWLLALIPLLALLIVAAPEGAQAKEDFLLPDQAFQISATALDPTHVLVRWKIAPGYYIYASKIRFRSETLGVVTEEPGLPTAELKKDPNFGEVPIYRNLIEAILPLKRDPGSESIVTLEATSQGCAEAGLCYPPHRQKLMVELLPVFEMPPPPESSAAPARGSEPPAIPDLAGLPGPGGPQGKIPDMPPVPAAMQALQPGPTGAPGAPGAGPELPPELSGAAKSGLGESLGLGDPEGDILDVADAFRFQAEVAAPDRLQLGWDIAPGTYLYRDRLSVQIEDASGVSLGAFERPPGEVKRDSVRPDGTIGDIEVYHGHVGLSLPLQRESAAATAMTLVAKYQGCAEIGICYPPQTQRIKLQLPEARAAALSTRSPAARAAEDLASQPVPVAASPAPAAPSQDSGAAPRSEQDRIAAVLANDSLWAIIAVFFGFGLLLAFTPCVFPMIPILAGIIAGQGATITTGRAFLLSLVYVLAMALTYTLVGILAGLFGANLQALFQSPWILITFALVFVLLALSMFGFYDLQLPSSLQSRLAELSNRQQGGTLIGVAIMGLLSALIVGPCVAPPLFGALIYISQTGDALLGGVALFALSLGMGAPLIAIGTSAGKLLPRAGAWMDAVKAVFGVALLGVAILLLERILPAAVAMLLWGLLLICSAVYLGALTQPAPGASGWSKLWKGLGVVLLIYGALMLVGAAAGGKDTLQPLRGLGLGSASGAGGVEHISFKRIKTVADLERELASAASAGKPVLLDFYADWCVSCKEMERYTFSDPGVITEMGRFVLLQADVTANDDADRALMQEKLGIPGPPAILFFDTQGHESKDDRLVGFKPADAFLSHLRGIGR